MKKILILILVSLMCFLGCDKEKEQYNTGNDNPSDIIDIKDPNENSVNSDNETLPENADKNKNLTEEDYVKIEALLTVNPNSKKTVKAILNYKNGTEKDYYLGTVTIYAKHNGKELAKVTKKINEIIKPNGENNYEFILDVESSDEIEYNWEIID